MGKLIRTVGAGDVLVFRIAGDEQIRVELYTQTGHPGLRACLDMPQSVRFDHGHAAHRRTRSGVVKPCKPSEMPGPASGNQLSGRRLAAMLRKPGGGPPSNS